MRYFFSLARPESTLSIRIIVLATARCTVALGCPVQRGGSRQTSTAVSAIDVTAVAVTTDNDLAVTTRTLKHPGTEVHRHVRPMRAGVCPVLVRSLTDCAKARFGAWRQFDRQIMAGAMPVSSATPSIPVFYPDVI